jgi:hypothetical protein
MTDRPGNIGSAGGNRTPDTRIMTSASADAAAQEISQILGNQRAQDAQTARTDAERPATETGTVARHPNGALPGRIPSFGKIAFGAWCSTLSLDRAWLDAAWDKCDENTRAAWTRVAKALLDSQCAEDAWTSRETAFARQRGRCFYCGEPLTLAPAKVNSFVLDHLTPRSKGGPDDLQNRVAACLPCDQAKGDRMPSFSEVARQQAIASTLTARKRGDSPALHESSPPMLGDGR